MKKKDRLSAIAALLGLGGLAPRVLFGTSRPEPPSADAVIDELRNPEARRREPKVEKPLSPENRERRGFFAMLDKLAGPRHETSKPVRKPKSIRRPLRKAAKADRKRRGRLRRLARLVALRRTGYAATSVASTRAHHARLFALHKKAAAR
jgi:hypothetical protein